MVVVWPQGSFGAILVVRLYDTPFGFMHITPPLHRRWPKRAAELDEWAVKHRHLDIADLLSSGYTSMEAWFKWPSPWPVPLQRGVVQRLVSTYDLWREQLHGLDESVYLGIWLFDIGLMESQLVAAVGDRAKSYADMHVHGEPAAPPSLYDTADCSLTRFAWTQQFIEAHDPITGPEAADRERVVRCARSVVGQGSDRQVITRTRIWRARLAV
jgi:hypothetical protein